MTSAARRFTFDTDFGPQASNPGAVVHRRKSTYTFEELEEARTEGYQAGRRDETARAEGDAARALHELAQGTGAILGRLLYEEQSLRRDATTLALSAARAVAGASLDAWPQDRIIAAVEAALGQLRSAPRIAVRVSDDLAKVLQPRLDQAADMAGYAGQIVVRADPAAAPGDVTLVWEGGMIADDRAGALAQVEALVLARLVEAELQEQQAASAAGGSHV
jgi:flagellar assembly protein FliH